MVDVGAKRWDVVENASERSCPSLADSDDSSDSLRSRDDEENSDRSGSSSGSSSRSSSGSNSSNGSSTGLFNADTSSAADDAMAMVGAAAAAVVIAPLTEPDLYGQRHPIESEALIAHKLDGFEREVDRIEASDKRALTKA